MNQIAMSDPRRVLAIVTTALCMTHLAPATAAEPSGAGGGQHPSSSAEGSPTIIHVGIGLKADTPQGQGVLYFGSRLSALTKGRLRAELHDGGQLGDDVKMIEALRSGRQEMTCPDSSTLASLVRDFSAVSYPFTFLDEREADLVLDGPWGQSLLAKLPAKGLVGLAFWENGFRHFTNSKRPLHTAQDFAGIRMRTMQNPMLVDTFKALHFTPVPLAFPKVYAALRDGDVDGQENPLPTILSSRFYEVQRYLTLSRHVYSAFVLLVSKKTWDSLTAEDQKAMQQAALEARDFERKLNRKRNEEALEALKAAGMQVTSFSREDAERTRLRLRSVLEKYDDEIGPTVVLQLYIALGQSRTVAAPPASTGSVSHY